MPRYKVWFDASKSIEVEADDEDKAIELADKQVNEEPADWTFADIDNLEHDEKSV